MSYLYSSFRGLFVDFFVILNNANQKRVIDDYEVLWTISYGPYVMMRYKVRVMIRIVRSRNFSGKTRL